MRDQLLAIYEAAIRAVQPQALLPAWVQREGDSIRLGNEVFDRREIRHFYVLAVGKAAAPMADELELLLGDLISEGLVITKAGQGLELQYMRCVETAHPVPDFRSLEAAYAVENMLQRLSGKDLLLVLLSGGASSLLADLAPGITLQAFQDLSQALLSSGAEIREMNAVRKHLSRLKGGQLARLAQPARVVCLALSDVIGDWPDVIGSGPTVPDPTTYAEAYAILERYGLTGRIDQRILDHLQTGIRGEIPETPKPGDDLFDRTAFHVIGSNRLALEAAAQKAMELGFAVWSLGDSLRGEARHTAVDFCLALEQYQGRRPVCLLAGGETTVTVRGTGKGGRNQEAALSVLDTWLREGRDPARVPALLFAATDGTDGPTDAAGAVVDGPLLQWCLDGHVHATNYLEQQDAYGFFRQTDAHFFTGPTQTNVMDLFLGILT